MNKIIGVAKVFAIIGVFVGIIFMGLGFIIRHHSSDIMKNGCIHAVVVDTGKVHTEVEEIKDRRPKRRAGRKRYNVSYRITWYQDIDIRLQNGEIRTTTLDFNEETISYRPLENELITELSGFEKGQELDIYIDDDGNIFPAKRIEKNVKNATSFIYAGIIIFVAGIGVWIGIFVIKKRNRE